MEQTDTPQAQRQIKPPYYSVAKLDKTIELVSTRNYTDINTSTFLGYGFGTTDALLAVSTLRFLGLIDDNGKPTELMQKVRLKGDVRKKEFEGIVRSAYSKLFEVVDEPQNLPTDELYNEFVAQYNLSGRLANTAIPVFNRLLEYAGLKEEGAVQTRKRQPKKVGAKLPPSKRQVKSREESGDGKQYKGMSEIVVAGGRFIMHVPTSIKEQLLDNDDMNDDWRVMKKAIQEFADKYVKGMSEEGEEENGGEETIE